MFWVLFGSTTEVRPTSSSEQNATSRNQAHRSGRNPSPFIPLLDSQQHFVAVVRNPVLMTKFQLHVDTNTASPGPVPGIPASHEEPFYMEHELKSPSKLGSTLALQWATSCASGTEIWVGSQSCPGVGRVARRRGSHEAGKAGRRGNEPTEMQPFWFWHSDRCLASSRSLDWRLEAQRAVPSKQHFCDTTRCPQTQLFHVSAQAAGKHRWSGSLLPGVTRSVIAASNGCPVRQQF